MCSRNAHFDASEGLLFQRGLVSRPALEEHVMHHLDMYGIAVLCSGSGMGKTALLQLVLERQSDKGHAIRFISLLGLDEDEATSAICDAVQNEVACTKDEHPILALDGIPALNEDHVDTVSTVLRSYIEKGGKLIAALRPDAEMLPLALDVPCIYARHMLVHESELPYWGIFPVVSAQEGSAAWTHNIPAFVRLMRDAPQHSHSAVDLHEIARLSQDIITGDTRSSFLEEERKLRYALALLGEGSIHDLVSAVGSSDVDSSGKDVFDGDAFTRDTPRTESSIHEILLGLERDEPLFGIDFQAATFSVLGACDTQVFLYFEDLIKDAFKRYPQLALKCAELLCEHKAFARAGVVLAHGAIEATWSLILKWPVDFIDAGCLRLVKAAHEESLLHVQSTPSFVIQASDIAISWIEGKTAQAERSFEALDTPRDPAEIIVWQQLEAMRCMAHLRAGTLAGRTDTQQPTFENRLVEQVYLHIDIWQLIMQGNFAQAYRLSILMSDRLSVMPSVMAAILHLDHALIRFLVGDIPQVFEDAVDKTLLSFLLEAGLSDELTYAMMKLGIVRVLIAGSSQSKEMKRAVVCASRRGDALVEALSLMGLAVQDMRKDALARGHVRASRSASLLEQKECRYLASIALGIDAIAMARLGDIQPLEELASREANKTLCSLFVAVYQAYTGNFELAHTGFEAAGPAVPILGAAVSNPANPINAARFHAQSLSSDELLPLRLLFDAAGGDKSPLAKALPKKWISQLGDFAEAGSSCFVVGEAAAQQAQKQPEPQDDILFIQLLGSFRVKRGSQEISDKHWKRSAAKQLLILLASQANHTMSRSALIEAIWPDTDYLHGRTNLYTALSTLRQTLGTTSDGNSYITGHNSELMLNREYVHCDIDDLVALCRSSLALGEQAHDRLSAVRKVMMLYEGDCYVPANDVSGLVLARRNELRNIYVDTMVLGSQTALHVGNLVEAAAFAEAACRRAPLREDAVLARVCALTAAGRLNEAREAYDSYAARSIEITGEPPSARLRKAASQFEKSSTYAPRLTEESFVGTLSGGESHIGVTSDGDSAKDRLVVR